ncbi:MAG: flagellar basal body P-ring protein FlgI [Isosphaeraceae bacterium]
MWRLIPGETWVTRTLVILLVLAQAQSSPNLMAAAPKKNKATPVVLKRDETVGDLAYVLQGGEIKVEGVGLVAGLENTGADPPPSWWRNQLVDEMSKAGVEHASKLLGNPQFSMVLVRMVIPAGANPQDRLDIEVEVPPACGTTSLAGGYLMATRLREVMIAGGAPRTGADLAIAQGPVMIGNAKDPNNPKAGRVLGGGRVKKESPFTLVIKDKRKSIRTAAILEKVINERFYSSEGSKQKGAATAKTDAYLTLKVPPSYHQNQERFFRVVQLLSMVDTPELRAERAAAWGKELQDVSRSGVAALKLEGLGKSGIEALKPGLQSEHPQVRFLAAESLAYLDDPVGVDVLGETAVKLPKFRAYSLAALAAMDQSASHIKLRKLMDEPDVEVRYGAFNALRTLDPSDPMLGRVRVLDDPRAAEEEADAEDSMALQMASAATRPRVEDPFALYIVDSEGPPVVHVSRSRRSEIVIFGRAQKLMPPMVLGTGAILLNASDKDEHVEISKIVPSKFGDADLKVRSSLELGEVVRRVANLGATYPELVTILEGASRQKNLVGTLVVDAVPVSNMDYLAAILGRDATKAADPEAKPAAASGGTSRLRRLLGFKGRDAAETKTASAKQSPGADPASTAGVKEGQPGGNAGAAARADVASTDPTAKPGQADGPKKDDSLQKAGGEKPGESRPRLLNRFFRTSR